MTDSAQRLVHEIDRDASGHIALPEDVTSPGNRNRYIVNSLIEEAFRSSQLEGASTTRRVAKEMIHTKRKPRTRQLAVLNDALQHPDTRITIEGHRALSRVVYQTARTDLLRLAALGYLDQLKVGKKLYFVPRPDLARKLKLLK